MGEHNARKAKCVNGATNPRIEARNAIAQEQARAAGISVDDQHSLMTGHLDLYQDAVHFWPPRRRHHGRSCSSVDPRCIENVDVA